MHEPNVMVIHPTILETLHIKPHGGTRGKVIGSSCFIAWELDYLPNFATVYFISLDWPNWQIDVVLHRATAQAHHVTCHTGIFLLPLHTFVTPQIFFSRYFALKYWLIFSSFVILIPPFFHFLSWFPPLVPQDHWVSVLCGKLSGDAAGLAAEIPGEGGG